ncbi:MAG TPA: alpha/beta hydrolase [Ramlibacter sp.]|nr:alpha/beta hydrolase [Ramlibacter sp.]
MPGPAIVFVHGYMDSAQAWSAVIDCMPASDVALLAIDLQEQDGSSQDSAMLLDGFAGQVVAACHALHACAEIVLVGHSMGGAVVELAAERLGPRVKGVALITPAPLAGFPLPAEAMQRFMSRLGSQDVDALAAGRMAMSRSLSEQGLQVLVQSSLRTSRSRGLQQLLAWTGGHPTGAARSPIGCPVIIVASEDKFFTLDALRRAASRYANAQVVVVSGAGHWAHVEKPQDIAGIVWRLARSVFKPPRLAAEHPTGR